MLKPGHSIEAAQEYASLYALKALTRGETDAYEQHVGEGCGLCQAELEATEATLGELSVLTRTDPPSGLRDRILDRIRSTDTIESEDTPQVWKKWESSPAVSEASPPPDATTRPDRSSVRAEDTEWEATGYPGIEVRRLHVDRARQYVTMLVRMAPGASYRPHRHHDTEESFVLEGEVRVGDEVFRAGDYQRAEAGSVHGIQSTETGCTLLILSSTQDKPLP